jgi:hypothetical protein
MTQVDQTNSTEQRDKLLTIIAAAYQVAGAHNAPAHILDVLANPEATTLAQVEGMIPYQPGLLITITYNDLMTLAKRLIGEQLDDCDEDFMAGRAHGIGSLHSEILGMAKQSVARQVQVAPKTAGAPKTCRSSEKVQAICDAYESGIGHGLQCDGHHSGAAFADPDAATAYELGYEEGNERGARDQNPLSSEPAAGLLDTAANSLSAMLWLYRRLSPGYGRLAVIEGPILALAKQTGIDVAECLAERGPDPQLPN